MRRPITVLLVAALAFPTAWSTGAVAQSFPTRAVRILVGQGAGGPSDVVARLIAEKLAERWKQPVLVENRPGASGTIVAEFVAKAPPDGYTLLLASHSNLVLAQAADTGLRYDSRQDFALIGRIAHVPFVLVANARLPLATIQELVAYARQHPGRLTYATSGNLTMSHVGIKMFSTRAGISMVDVPYKASGTAIADLLAGRVDMFLTDLAPIAPHLQSGALRALGSGSRSRLPQAPGIPTIAEQGFPGFSVEPWYGLAAPTAIPADVQAELARSLASARKLPDVKQRLEQLGYEPIEDTPEQFGALILTDIDKYSAVIKTSGIGAKP